MARYKVARDYRAVYRGRLVAHLKGSEVEIDDPAEAEWVERDSPGTLTEIKPPAKKAAAKGSS